MEEVVYVGNLVNEYARHSPLRSDTIQTINDELVERVEYIHFLCRHKTYRGYVFTL